MKSWYYQGQCCTEATWEPNANGGTGMDARADISSPDVYRTELYISYDVYWDAVTGDFENSNGHKLPGLQPEVNTLWGVGRMMNVNSSYYQMDPAYYTHAYWNGYGSSNTLQSNTKTGGNWFSSGVKINITIRMSYGTVGTSDGFMELFVDGIFIGGQGLGSAWPGDGRYNIPFHPSGSPDGWGGVQMSTFMGGESTGYQSPKDQFMLLGKVTVWGYSGSATGIPRYDDASPRSGPLRDITGALTTLGYDL